MDPSALRNVLESVRTGGLSVEAAVDRMRSLPFEDLEFAKVDHHRAIRCGFPEVVYAEGKTTHQLCEIFKTAAAAGGNILATRVSPSQAEALQAAFPACDYHQTARTVSLRQEPPRPVPGVIGVVAAGTTDLPVAEEACATARILDATVETVWDVGVAGLHRLLAHHETLRRADVLIVVAGMEGALSSVVGGLVEVPVIGVPTSVGYGASFRGLAALLAMLNSCASGVTVVNIDNGFGAGMAAVKILRRIGAARGGSVE